MTIGAIARYLESIAPLSLQEDYDNAGLLVGDPYGECSGVLCTLDVTEEVIAEALEKGCNCIVAHHPLIFRGLKKLTGSNQVERAVVMAIKADMAIFASHTNLDNIISGVNGRIADKIGLVNRQVIYPKEGTLKKIYTFVPATHLEKVRNALFEAGAGDISDYSECSFTTNGQGTFKPGESTAPYAGNRGVRHAAEEVKLELILPAHREQPVLQALFNSHPYEEVAYDLVKLLNKHSGTGSGLIGDLAESEDEHGFLTRLVDQFNLKIIRHTPFTGRAIKKVAICGGAGSFLISRALSLGADAYVTGDVKYHEFFGAEGRMLLCDIGHFESEQFTTDLLVEILLQKFPTFAAVLKSEIKTNPVNYFSGK